jgi:arylsulfatase A-like enzyme
MSPLPEGTREREIPPAARARPTRIAAAIVACTALALGCTRPADPERPNVVLISIDSLRPDHLGCYGYERRTSPCIDELAGESLLFENAYSVTTWTLPSHLSLLTGLYPEVHGVQLDDRRLSPKAELLPEILAARGYRSAAVVAGPYLSSTFGYDQGWVSYDDAEATAGSASPIEDPGHSRINSPAVHRRAVEALDRLGGGPFLLFVHYWDVHYDYLPPPPYDTLFDPDYTGDVAALHFLTNDRIHAGMPPRDLEHIVALYDGEIRSVDGWLCRLFEELERRGLFDDALIVVTADHGDEFFEHGEKGHRENLFDTTLRVPLLIRPPGGIARAPRETSPASLVDLAPTIAAAAGVERPPAFSGVDLLAGDGDGRLPAGERDLRAQLETHRHALLRGPWKLIAPLRRQRFDPGRVLLFDRTRDAQEQTDLARERPELAQELFAELWRSRRRLQRQGEPIAPLPQDLDPALVEQLRALGYL